MKWQDDGRALTPGRIGLGVAAIASIALIAYFVLAEVHRARSAGNLERIGAAFGAYEVANGHFPPDVRGQDGQALLSWRVRILPLLGQNALFREFRLDEPWDSPHNRGLLGRMPAVYAIPGSRAAPGMTFYRGFSGKSTLFDPAFPQGVTLQSIIDGTSGTLAVVEARETVPWTRPDSEIVLTDEVREAGPYNLPLSGESRFVAEQYAGGPIPKTPEPAVLMPLRVLMGGHHRGGFNALFCDGSVHFVREAINLVVLRALITRDRGENLSADSA